MHGQRTRWGNGVDPPSDTKFPHGLPNPGMTGCRSGPVTRGPGCLMARILFTSSPNVMALAGDGDFRALGSSTEDAVARIISTSLGTLAAERGRSASQRRGDYRICYSRDVDEWDVYQTSEVASWLAQRHQRDPHPVRVRPVAVSDPAARHETRPGSGTAGMPRRSPRPNDSMRS